MDEAELRRVRDRLDEERRTLPAGGRVIERLPFVTRLRSADGSHHAVVWSGLNSGNADEVIAGEVGHYLQLGAGFEWKLYGHDSPADLASRLARRGFEIGPREVVMACDLRGGAPRWLAGTGGPAVGRVETLEQVGEFRRVAEEVFGKNYEFTAGELARELSAGSTDHRGYVARDSSRPVGIGRLYTHADSAFGGLYGGATLGAYRGRGFYRATVAARARDAVASGARWLIVDALPTSRPILEHMGFERLTETWPCEWRQSGDSARPRRG